MELLKTIFLLCSVATCVQVVICSEFSYDGLHGPAPNEWYTLYPDCGGSSQSPINIQSDKAVYSDDLGPLVFQGWDVPPSSMTLTNNGHSAQVDFDYDAYLSGGGLPAKYRVQQFHFHWGSDMSQGSEHTFDGHRFPLEMHIVLYSTNYPDFDSAAQQKDGLAVLSVFFWDKDSSGEVPNSFHEILDGLAQIPVPEDSVQLAPFALSDLLPESTSDYYRYSGSLTTPGCYETVLWTLLAEPVYITDSQMESFRSLRDVNNHPLVNNFRPIQATNNREITSTFHKTWQEVIAFA